jgi:hypothetical protein
VYPGAIPTPERGYIMTCENDYSIPEELLEYISFTKKKLETVRGLVYNSRGC